MHHRLVLTLALAVSVAVAVLAEPALAAPTDVGENAGKIAESWGKALLLGVATLVGLPALAKRDVGEGFKIGLVVLIIGGFVFASDTIKTVIEGLWQLMAQ